MKLRSTILALLAAVAAAGCAADDEPGAPTTPAPGRTDDARNVTTEFPISVQVSAPGDATPDARGDVPVEANATALLVEARWTCTSPTCDFDLVVLDANGTEVATASGGGRLAASVEAPANGTYAVEMRAASAVANADGQIRATVFYGPVPDGFTAFEDEGADRRRAR